MNNDPLQTVLTSHNEVLRNHQGDIEELDRRVTNLQENLERVLDLIKKQNGNIDAIIRKLGGMAPTEETIECQ